MPVLNLGILAHVDAGKTSLTERLLHAAGVLAEPGRVDAGTTSTDTLALERARGITIRSAVVAFSLGDTTVDLLDTPGHPDFIAEVERVLAVLDGAVLVVSAVEGVQPQTRILMRTLQRLRIPVLLFVNKLDRAGADRARVLAEITRRLTPATVPMGQWFSGTRLTEVLAEHDDEVLRSFVADEPLSGQVLQRHLAGQLARALVHPVYFGSAITGQGVPELLAGIRDLLPVADEDTSGKLSGTVFKVERGAAGEKIAYVRLFAGALHVRDRLPAGKVSALSVFADGGESRCTSVGAGHIARLWGLSGARIGDPVGLTPAAGQPQFAPPTLETVVVPRDPADRGRLHTALTQLAEQDPLIGLRVADTGEISLSLYGEVQREVIEATLGTEYGVAVTFHRTETLCVEKVVGCGCAEETLGANPFVAGVGLRVEPGPPGSGVTFGYEIELGSLIPAFFNAIEETVHDTLRAGVHGWQVIDCAVTLTSSGYDSISSTAGDFRGLPPLVLAAALTRAATVVHEPVHAFTLTVPSEVTGPLGTALARFRAVPHTTARTGDTAELSGFVPAEKSGALQRALPSLTHGEGTLETSFSHYAPIHRTVPDRPRRGRNPFDREEYLVRGRLG
ncbi:TetM/TetW/TetO/TetS family tetracycline resistance ribosomal protection protein [Amycolatopsis ultiminotia]|uniref:TetM/TetW/TetO/TetS family tetracycline resistance ribosomal protection protein n=1 Tax=Amycolatopsis ultiminotia TaxID=543629 RepID=A0ABP6WBT6_9PSEU